MTYESVDKLQKVLATEVFQHTKDPKKAAGRALGTLVEIIVFYLLKTWGLHHQLSIEKALQEYGNPLITHNVEYSLHPVLSQVSLFVEQNQKSVTANRILQSLSKQGVDISSFTKKNNVLLTNGILRNCCTIGESASSYLLCNIKDVYPERIELIITEQHKKPYAVFECKRVGIEEGMTKGPQTIEKAKQGAYVARSASSLQKIRSEQGEMQGILYRSNGSYLIKPYYQLLEEIIATHDKELLRKFILTVGIVSNHGNWIKKNKNGYLEFGEEHFQKELMVLAHSYDWLLFLTDKGLSEFIEQLLLKPSPKYNLLKDTFLKSYQEGKKKNEFTKVQMNIEADALLLEFFTEHLSSIEKWFVVVAPQQKSLDTLQEELLTLKKKNWSNYLS